ncbi:MAG: class I adenylate cyclase [Gammaproteobacteria bacterium]
MHDGSPLTLVSDSSPLHLKTIKRRFAALNSERLSRVRESLKPQQRVFVDILPLLFHINEPALPGFVNKKTPAGVADFGPGKRAVEAAGTLVRKFSYRRRALRVYNIQALYLMGSTGTVAYSQNSDFDIWLCHHPRLTDNQLGLLQEKCARIRAWAESLGLEVKFFVMDAANFRRGETEALSEDSSGSAQHRLLLEEFYRTGLLLAGRYPAWWLVPPDREQDYDAHVRNLANHGLEHEFLDFGSVGHIPAGEFLGAALWQLHKAIDSPYKSVLKLLLMEAYAAEYPQPDLLCTRFKRALYDGETNVDRLDPYVLMSIKVQEYLQGRGERERLELARKCFYFKVNEHLSDRRLHRGDRRAQLLAELTRRWQWGQDHLLILDSRATWKIHRVLEERRMLVDELTRSYRILSDFARHHAGNSSLSSTDLNLLGRRLYTAFERKAGKVEIINPGISTDLTEERLNFIHVDRGPAGSWALQRGDPDAAPRHQPEVLKRSPSLIELVAWCHFNRIIGPQTLITLEASNGTVSHQELLAVIDSFRRLFPDGRLPHTDMDNLHQPVRVASSSLYINLGVDPLLEHTRQGVHLTSNRSDAFSYGGFWKNLALSFDLMLVSSWGEVLTFHYSGEAALLDCLCEYLAWAPLSAGTAPPQVPVYSFSTARGMAIAHRVGELFRDVTQVFYGNATGAGSRYVLRIEHTYFLIGPENDVPRFQRLGNEAELVKAMGVAQERFSPVIFDRYAVGDSPLARVMEQNRPDTVQLFYLVRDNQADVYIVDEYGSLFHQVTEYHSETALLGQYQHFLASAIARCNATEHAPDEAQISTLVEFYQVRRDRGGQYSIQRKKPRETLHSDPERYLGIQVIGGPQERRDVFSLYCEGHEFSSLEFGERIYAEVARYVLGQRQGRQRYPIYITDADVGRALLGAEAAGRLQTVHFLNYKKAIERELSAALQRL